MGLDGKVALVTGGVSGLGREIVEVLLENKCKVAICDINQKEGEAVLKLLKSRYGEDKVLFKQCDISLAEQQEDVFKATIEHFNQLDIVINNAGVLTEHQWEAMVAVNVNGVIRGTFLAFKYMDKNSVGNGGVVLNISSINGLMNSQPQPVYSSTKHAVRAFSQAISLNSMDMYGVRVNIMCPGSIETGLYDRVTDPTTCPMYCFGHNCTEIMTKAVMEYPAMSPRKYARAMLPLIENESYNGHTQCITPDGIADIPVLVELSHLHFKPLPQDL